MSLYVQASSCLTGSDTRSLTSPLKTSSVAVRSTPDLARSSFCESERIANSLVIKWTAPVRRRRITTGFLIACADPPPPTSFPRPREEDSKRVQQVLLTMEGTIKDHPLWLNAS